MRTKKMPASRWIRRHMLFIAAAVAAAALTGILGSHVHTFAARTTADVGWDLRSHPVAG
jgi:hypothetical protein